MKFDNIKLSVDLNSIDYWPVRILPEETFNCFIVFGPFSNLLCIAKPGLIDGPDRRQGLVMNALSTVGRSIIGLPKVDVSQIAATLLKQAIKGIEKETLLNEDLIIIGNKVLSN